MFYVYVYFFADGRPAYVGKGKGDRWRSRHTNKQLNGAVRNAGELPAVIVRDGMNEAEAFETEMALIEAIGRSDQQRGPLLNHTDGGQGVSGLRHSAETREAIRAIKAEHKRDRISIAQLQRFADLGERANLVAAQIGKRRSPEHRAAISAGNVGRIVTNETRAKLSAAMAGYSPEAKAKNSAYKKQWWADRKSIQSGVT